MPPRKRRPVEKCRLCLKVRPLCRSHIIPEYCYAQLFDPKNHTAVSVSRGREVRQTIQTGEWEYLLCEACDQLLNTGCEAYFKRVWYDRGSLPNKLRPGPFRITGLDHDKFRLFHLSILWRVSLSNRPVFLHAKLAAGYQERIRKILIAQDGSLEPGAFSFIADCLLHNGRPFHAISDAQKIRYNPAIPVYVVMYAGCAWKFFAASYTPPEIANRVLTPGGDMPMVAFDLFRYFELDDIAAVVSDRKL